MAQRRAFACEQLSIQTSDAISFAHLAGHRGFLPTSLAASDLVVPTTPQIPFPKYKDYTDLFQFLMGGEIYAASLLLDYARSLGMEGETAIQQARPCSPLAQAYPSYWARLALSNERAAGAAACAVNFPAWGKMCKRLLEAMQTSNPEKLAPEQLEKALAFIQFFATPIENLDDMAAAVMMQSFDDSGDTDDCLYQKIAGHVRLLQEYEVFFWDACYTATVVESTK